MFTGYKKGREPLLIIFFLISIHPPFIKKNNPTRTKYKMLIEFSPYHEHYYTDRCFIPNLRSLKYISTNHHPFTPFIYTLITMVTIYIVTSQSYILMSQLTHIFGFHLAPVIINKSVTHSLTRQNLRLDRLMLFDLAHQFILNIKVKAHLTLDVYHSSSDPSTLPV